MDIWVDGKDAVVTEASVTPIRPVIPLAALAIWDPKPPTKLVRSERGHWTLHNRCHRCDNGPVRQCGLYDVSGGRGAVSATSRRRRDTGRRCQLEVARVLFGRNQPSLVEPPINDGNGLIGRRRGEELNRVARDKVLSVEMGLRRAHVTRRDLITSAGAPCCIISPSFSSSSSSSSARHGDGLYDSYMRTDHILKDDADTNSPSGLPSVPKHTVSVPTNTHPCSHTSAHPPLSPHSHTNTPRGVLTVWHLHVFGLNFLSGQ